MLRIDILQTKDLGGDRREYQYKVLITKQKMSGVALDLIKAGTLEHNRSDGWQRLVELVVEDSKGGE